MKNRYISQIIFVISFFKCSLVFGEGRFYEIIARFNEPKNFTFEEDFNRSSLSLFIENVTSDELEAFYNYDEKVIKRLLIKEIPPKNAKIIITLNDKNLKTTIFSLEEPFRIVVNIYDSTYGISKDPSTGLPLSGLWVEDIASSSTERKKTDTQNLLTEPAHAIQNQLSMQASNNNEKSDGKRRLLQPSYDLGETESEWEQRLQKISSGRGSYWSKAPIYVYPILIASYEGRGHPAGWAANLNEPSMTKGQKIATLAYKMASFGDEKRALAAYQELLHIEPKVFEKDPVHLWSFAECHLAEGNLVLAEGYYKTIIERFAGSPFAALAMLRTFDIKSIYFLSKNDTSAFAQLLEESMPIEPKNEELKTQLKIRQSFWKNPDFHNNNQSPPPVDEKTAGFFREVLGSLENKKTSFLAYSIYELFLLNFDSLFNEDKNISIVKEYFARYDKETGSEYYSYLKKFFYKKISEKIQNLYESKNYASATEIAEKLKEETDFIASYDLALAWPIAESYRQISQYEKAIRYYYIISEKDEKSVRKLKSAFWVSYLSSKKEDKNLSEKITKIDKEAQNTWLSLSEDDQKTVQTSYKMELEECVREDNNLALPALILFDAWTKNLSTQKNGSSGNLGSTSKNEYSPSSSAITSLDYLAKKLQKLGKSKERKVILSLMQKIKPKDVADDKEAKKIWNDSQLSFAEELREMNELLDAGRTYVNIAEQSEDGTSRAEALYKGGLLLYRAGKREEAMKAFTQASQDTNNLFYANLAKERINQMNH